VVAVRRGLWRLNDEKKKQFLAGGIPRRNAGI